MIWYTLHTNRNGHAQNRLQRHLSPTDNLFFVGKIRVQRHYNAKMSSQLRRHHQTTAFCSDFYHMKVEIETLKGIHGHKTKSIVFGHTHKKMVIKIFNHFFLSISSLLLKKYFFTSVCFPIPYGHSSAPAL